MGTRGKANTKLLIEAFVESEIVIGLVGAVGANLRAVLLLRRRIARKPL